MPKIILKLPDFEAMAEAALAAIQAGETPIIEHLEVLKLIIEELPDDTGIISGADELSVERVHRELWEEPLSDRRRPLPGPVPGGLHLGQRVVCAANRSAAGDIVLGARHYDDQMREAMRRHGGDFRETWAASEQGFIDQRGNFLTREEARVIAVRQNQLVRRCGGDSTELFSENLY